MISPNLYGFIFLSHKSQVFPAFVQLRNIINAQFNCDIKCIQTNWGGEFCNVSIFIHTHGIDHRLSCPHTLEQKAFIEHGNHIIIEEGLTLLAHSSIP